MLRDSHCHQRRRKLIINFIRHGKTAGNTEKRFIGRTDEPLCDIGKDELKRIAYPECDIVAASPMKRCLQTAQIIYPTKKPMIYDELRECDFGIFDGRCHAELDGDPVYMKWISNNGMTAPPEGEDVDGFRGRCVTGFLRAVRENANCTVMSFVVHGGTIMSVLEKLAFPKREFYEYMTENGHGYVTEYDGEKLRILGKI